MSRPSIPDNIYNNRCRYCMHFTGLPNTTGELSQGQLFSCKPSTPCNIISIANYCEQKIISYHPISCTYEVHDNECFSFTPNYGYPGICDSCRYSNHSFDESDYCSLPKEEITDRRPLLIGYTFGQRKTDYWTYAYHTCSKWQLSDSWYNSAVKSTAEGRLPRTWDPNTRKLICSDAPDPKVIAIWDKLQKEAAEKNNVSVKMYDDEQITFFDK